MCLTKVGIMKKELTEVTLITEDGVQLKVATFVNTLSLKENFVNYLMQSKDNNFKSWEYPDFESLKLNSSISKTGALLVFENSRTYIVRRKVMREEKRIG